MKFLTVVQPSRKKIKYQIKKNILTDQNFK